MPAVLHARSLTVARGRRTVLRGVDLVLEPGGVVHLTGANGSGKTSLLRVLAGLTAPRAGHVDRAGACAWVPEKVVLTSALAPGEWLATMRRLRKLAPLDWTAATTASGLAPEVLRRSSATLSKGMLQRIALLEAVHADCPLLLLDEPFAGLDPDGREWLAERLRARLAAGAAVLLTDHSGAAAERLDPGGEVRLAGGAASSLAPAPSVAPDTLTISARHADGRRLERTVPEPASDALLRELLADGWHVESVRR